jgi:hypothetical protein
MKTYLWEILVPSTFNDGEEVSVVHHKKWDNYVKSIADGLTILKSAKGQWVSESGNVFFDTMIPVRIACTVLEIKKIADYTKKHYKQEKVMFYRISDKVHIY